MITRLYLRSLALGLTTAFTFWPAATHWWSMALWCALASVFVVDMIHAALTIMRIEESLLSKPEDGGGWHMLEHPPFRFVGCSKERKGNKARPLNPPPPWVDGRTPPPDSPIWEEHN